MRKHVRAECKKHGDNYCLLVDESGPKHCGFCYNFPCYGSSEFSTTRLPRGENRCNGRSNNPIDDENSNGAIGNGFWFVISLPTILYESRATDSCLFVPKQQVLATQSRSFPHGNDVSYFDTFKQVHRRGRNFELSSKHF